MIASFFKINLHHLCTWLLSQSALMFELFCQCVCVVCAGARTLLRCQSADVNFHILSDPLTCQVSLTISNNILNHAKAALYMSFKRRNIRKKKARESVSEQIKDKTAACHSQLLRLSDSWNSKLGSFFTCACPCMFACLLMSTFFFSPSTQSGQAGLRLVLTHCIPWPGSSVYGASWLDLSARSNMASVCCLGACFLSQTYSVKAKTKAAIVFA